MFCMTMEEWLRKHQGEVFRYWTYKKMFTPYETEQRFSDESVFEDNYASFGYLTEAIKLENGDFLLAFTSQDIPGYMHYRRLSDISLDWCQTDQVNPEEENE